VRKALILVAFTSLTSIACFPVISNLSKGSTVPKDLQVNVSRDSHLLVLPLWTDSDGFEFRDPYIIRASAIGTPEADVPRRMGFYIDSFACGGPSKFVMGYLLVPDTGSVVWSDIMGVRTSDDRSVIVGELKQMIASGNVGPRIRELAQYGDMKLTMHTKQENRVAALAFLEAMSSP